MEKTEKKKREVLSDVVVAYTCDGCGAYVDTLDNEHNGIPDGWHQIEADHQSWGRDSWDSHKEWHVCSAKCYFDVLKKILPDYLGEMLPSVDEFNADFAKKVIDYVDGLADKAEGSVMDAQGIPELKNWCEMLEIDCFGMIECDMVTSITEKLSLIERDRVTEGSCLTCKFEPDWSESNGRIQGHCKNIPDLFKTDSEMIFSDDKASCPYVERKFSFQAGHGTHTETERVYVKGCNTWEPKEALD